jgi:hypothetical protein
MSREAVHRCRALCSVSEKRAPSRVTRGAVLTAEVKISLQPARWRRAGEKLRRDALPERRAHNGSEVLGVVTGREA